MKYYLQISYYDENRLISIKSLNNNFKKIKIFLLEKDYYAAKKTIYDISLVRPKCKKSFRKYYLSNNLEFMSVSRRLIDEIEYINFWNQNFKTKLVIYEE